MWRNGVEDDDEDLEQMTIVVDHMYLPGLELICGDN